MAGKAEHENVQNTWIIQRSYDYVVIINDFIEREMNNHVKKRIPHNNETNPPSTETTEDEVNSHSES